MKTYPMRARIRNEGSGPARVDIFDDIGGDPLWGGGVSAQDFAAQMARVRGPLDVHVNSYGGDVFAGQTMAEAIRNHPGPVTVKVDGIAASIASVIVQAGAKRVMAPGALLMIHDAWGFAEGNAADMRSQAETLDKVSNVLAGEYARRAGGTVAQWRDVMRGERWYDAQEALDAGLADEVGGGAAQRPASVDVESLAARAPVRIMAALRSMPRAAAGMDDGDGDGGQPCKTCGGSGRLRHPGSGKNGMKCPGCDGSGTFGPGGDGDEPDEDEQGMQDRGPRMRAAMGMPYQPEPYRQAPCETVCCPQCGQYNCTDARYCDQCGCKLAGRTDMDGPGAESYQEPGYGYGDRGRRLRGAAEDLGDGWVRDQDGTVRFDPDGDGDDDSTPEGDTDHDYFAPDGTPVKPVPPCPVARGALTEDGMRAMVREMVREAAVEHAGPAREPEDSTDKTIFSQRLREMRAAMPALKGAGA